MKLRTLFAAVAALALFGACDRNVTYVEEDVQPANCFNCHSDEDQKLVAAEQQYFFSVHASGTAVTEPGDPCSGCHTSEGFISRVETGTLPDEDELTNPTAINCFTCHAPHSSGTLDRRIEDPVAFANGVMFDHHGGNLCTACHQARRNVDTYVTTPSGRVTFGTSASSARRWGPHHSTQGDMFTGTNGYEYTGYPYEQTGHKTDPGIEDGCLDCHYDVTANLRVGGHSFNMAYSDGTEDMVNTAACEGCHPSIGDDFDLDGYQTQTDSLATELLNRLVTAGLTNGNGEPLAVTTSSDSAGAVWNYLVVKEDRSRGVHNRKYIQGLLRSGIALLDGTLPAPFAAKKEEVPGGSR
jgi:hypothetical protein